MELPYLPPELWDMIYKELHRSYMKDICYYINHNLVWVRAYDKKKREFLYSFVIGEHRNNRFWALVEEESPQLVCYRRLPSI